MNYYVVIGDVQFTADWDVFLRSGLNINFVEQREEQGQVDRCFPP